jgi:hypothetical protein
LLLVVMADKYKILELLQKNLEIGTLEDHERAILEAWANKSEKNNQILHRWLSAKSVEDVLSEMYQVESAEAWKRMMDQIPPVPGYKPGYRIFSRLVAALILAIAGTLLSVFLLNQPFPATTEPGDGLPAPANGQAWLLAEGHGPIEVASFSPQGLQLRGFAVTTDPAKQVLYFSRALRIAKEPAFRLVCGSQRSIAACLPGGPEIYLNAGSVVSAEFPETGLPSVTVSGQIFVDLSADNAIQIAVNIPTIHGKSHANILLRQGAKVSICAYPEEKEASIQVLAGVVTLETRGVEVKQIPSGFEVSLAGPELLSSLQPARMPVQTSFSSLIEFHELPLSEALRRLSHWYGVQFAGADILRNTTVSGLFNGHEPLSKILPILQLGGQFSLTPAGNQYQISSLNIIQPS